ncbi:hypothetical protein IFR05_015853 [Cadophora sp. M221]|nr:hypothetical protein IFR05_015853 [Cadophora sp. M221]
MVRLSEKVAPKNVMTGEEDMQMWLEMYLRDVYEKGEVWGSEAWKMAREWNGDGVSVVVGSAGLVMGGARAGAGGEEVGGEEEGGFVVMDEEELELQIRWKKEGDWRAGSIPLGRPERLEEEGLRTPVTSSLPDLKDDSSLFYHAADVEYLSDTPQLQRGQRRRWRHTIGAQGQKKPAEPVTFACCQKHDDEANDLGPFSTSTTYEQLKSLGPGDVHKKPLSYYGDQGWTEITK